MFDSTVTILDMFIDTSSVSRFNIYSIAAERGENPEDVYYICALESAYYIVLETDYVLSTISDITLEAAEIAASFGFTPLRWIARKDSRQKCDDTYIPIDSPTLDRFKECIFSGRVSSARNYEMKYAVLELTNNSTSALNQ